MKNKFAFIDFEYNGSKSKLLNLVCCSMYISDTKKLESAWLYNDGDSQVRLADKLSKMKDEGYIFVSHYVPAEAHSFISLGLDPISFKWIDTLVEYRVILNHSDIMYGKHLIGGKVTFTTCPDFYETAKVNNSKPESNLAAMIYKMCKEKIDTEHKTKMRDLIISAPKEFSKDERIDIIKYCESDVTYLEVALSRIVAKFQNLLSAKPNNIKTLLSEMLLRGRFGADTAWMYSRGYSIDYTATVNFSDSVEDILSDIARDINKQFPNIKPFQYSPIDARYKTKTKHIRDWIKTTPFKNKWEYTPTKLYSLKLESFEKFFDYRHHFPRGNFGAQILRYLKTKQSMNGFRKSLNGKKSFWDFVGPDKRVRPFHNPFGSGTGRSQQSATSFIPLKSAWMRVLLSPPKGKAYCSIDYGSEEFLIAALASGDKKMIEAYRSGDVYMFYGKEIGMIPKDGKKADYIIERQVSKGVVLGIGYGLTKVGLSRKLITEVGSEWTEDKCQELIDKYNNLFNDYYNWKETEYDKYKDQGFLKLPCGFYQWGENKNARSVKNFLTQGFGTSIMRKAVELCHDRGLKLLFTLHDACYLEMDSFDYKSIDVFRQAMKDAFVFYFPEELKKDAELIRLDIEMWGLDFKESVIKDGKKTCTVITTPEGHKVDQEKLHIDSRSIDAYLMFKKYFKENKPWKNL